MTQLRHLVSPQRRCDHFHQVPRGGVEHGQELGHGEAASRCLIGGLTEELLEFERVGHGAARAIREHGAVPSPEILLLRLRDQRFDLIAEHFLEDPQGQASASLTEGRAGEESATEEGDVLQRGVAMKNLNDELVENRDRVERGVAPHMSHGATDGEDRFRFKMVSDILSDSLEDGINPVMHRGASLCDGVVRQHHRAGRPCLSQALGSSRLIALLSAILNGYLI